MQTILNFDIATTDKKLTPRTGIAIFGEYLKGLHFEKLCNTHPKLNPSHKQERNCVKYGCQKYGKKDQRVIFL